MESDETLGTLEKIMERGWYDEARQFIENIGGDPLTKLRCWVELACKTQADTDWLKAGEARMEYLRTKKSDSLN